MINYENMISPNDSLTHNQLKQANASTIWGAPNSEIHSTATEVDISGNYHAQQRREIGLLFNSRLVVKECLKQSSLKHLDLLQQENNDQTGSKCENHQN